ncbi:MAG: DUF4783 domain-containing protein [Rhodothermales bacterium]|nr:DUF4783 domain-containing protein [Rhodothermales bacterium]
MLRRFSSIAAVLLVLLPGVRPAGAQPVPPALERLEAAVGAGDHEAVIVAAADRVELDVLGSRKLYSRAQASYVLHDFFRRYPPEAFAFDHATQAEGHWFATGLYRYRQGEQPLRVSVRLRSHEDGWTLRELRVEAPRTP